MPSHKLKLTQVQMSGAVKVLMFQAESEPHSAIQASIFEDSNYFKNRWVSAVTGMCAFVLYMPKIFVEHSVQGPIL